MFSATWPKEVRALASDFQVNPVFLNVGSMEISANHNIQQIVEVVDEYRKQARLFQILETCLTDVSWRVMAAAYETRARAFILALCKSDHLC